MTDKIVSFEDELLILVDQNDRELGYETKDKCHDGQGKLHRAFSIFIFNDKGNLLLQKRSEEKRLWPMYWSNSCCSHPRKGESYEFATKRRLEEELGLKTDLEFVYRFQYQAQFDHEGSEFELCSVYVGKSNVNPSVNATEIAEWKFISRTELNEQLKTNPEQFTPWFKMEWQRLSTEFYDKIQA